MHLERPSEVIKKVNRAQQKYDVTVAEWNPLSTRDQSVAIAVRYRIFILVLFGYLKFSIFRYICMFFMLTSYTSYFHISITR